MKANYTLLMAFAFFLLAFTAQATVYNETGSARMYRLESGDTLVISSGLFKGKVESNHGGWVLIVRQHATFAPTSFPNVRGEIFNYGNIEIGQQLTTSDGFKLENYGNFSVTAGVTFNGQQKVTINNRANGVMYFSHSLTYNAPVEMTNDGQILMANDLTLQGGSVLTNNNSITVAGILNINNGHLVNNKRLNTKKRLTVNSNGALTNNALLIAEGGLTNNGPLVNGGLVWVSATNDNDFVNNSSGSITMKPGSLVRTGSFTNNSAVNGEGTLYMLNKTVLNSSGSVGSNDALAGEMIVHDATRTTQLFDNQWGTIRRNVLYRPVTEPDTATYAAQKFIVLPIKWNGFDVKTSGNTAQLTWDAADTHGQLTFTVERSLNGQQFAPIAHTSGDAYTDAALPAGATTLYYRIKAVSTTGEVKYSAVKMVKLATINSASFQLWPNPAVQHINISYQSTAAQNVTIVIKNLGGQAVATKTMKAQAGANQFTLTEIANQSKGFYTVELWSATSLLASGKVVKQ